MQWRLRLYLRRFIYIFPESFIFFTHPKRQVHKYSNKSKHGSGTEKKNEENYLTNIYNKKILNINSFMSSFMHQFQSIFYCWKRSLLLSCSLCSDFFNTKYHNFFVS
jgi:hypothetical protein